MSRKMVYLSDKQVEDIKNITGGTAELIKADKVQASNAVLGNIQATTINPGATNTGSIGSSTKVYKELYVKNLKANGHSVTSDDLVDLFGQKGLTYESGGGGEAYYCLDPIGGRCENQVFNRVLIKEVDIIINGTIDSEQVSFNLFGDLWLECKVDSTQSDPYYSWEAVYNTLTYTVDADNDVNIYASLELTDWDNQSPATIDMIKLYFDGTEVTWDEAPEIESVSCGSISFC